jgi:hypothetical protein
MTKRNRHDRVKDDIKKAVESGLDVHQKIKTITLKALTERELDRENIKDVVESVSKGISDGMTIRSEQAKEIFTHAATALDDALAVAAEASKLAIEEASSKVSEYSHQDLNRAALDLQDLEGLFMDTLEKIADGNRLIYDVSGDFINHARQSGTAVGKQSLTVLESLKKLPHWGKEAVVSSAMAATITLAQLGSGILLGIAESLQPSHSEK